MANRTPRILITTALALLAAARAEAQSAHYKDGEFTGDPAEILWGNVQVKAVIQSGRIADVQFLQMPFDRARSVEITDFAKPLLKSEAITAQNAQVDLVSSATMTSLGFRETLASALAKAK
ncbi:MAG TPA: FMN-binding protein [Rhizomicrobium sp.]|nr:FMN-binding protein [Rhizomicrobium sp.]